jgi:Integrase zinc binding domain
VTGLGKQKSSLVFPGCTNTTQSSTGKREKLLLNPSESTGDALWGKANESDKNNSLR